MSVASAVPGVVRIAVVGALGRMGQRIIACAAEMPGMVVAARVDTFAPSGAAGVSTTLAAALTAAQPSVDVVIDFSAPEGAMASLEVCVARGVPLVIGTTGLTDAQRTVVADASRRIPVVLSPNMSVGVNTLFTALDVVLKALKDKGFDIEIVEAHHSKKKDAPSGTAVKLAEIVKENRPAACFVYGREGLVGERTPDEVGVFAVRGGDIVGEHTVIFAAAGEKLELKHTATSRDTFARGALVAARWLHRRSPGLYAMRDVLGPAG